MRLAYLTHPQLAAACSHTLLLCTLQPTITTTTIINIITIRYTSGSTAAPKGVIVSHGNLAHNLATIRRALKRKRDVVVVSWLPQYHDMGLIGSHLGSLYGTPRPRTADCLELLLLIALVLCCYCVPCCAGMRVAAS